MKKRVLLLGASVFLVACGNNNTAVTTTPTTTTTTETTTSAPIIEKVAYDMGIINMNSDMKGSVIFRLEGKNNILSKILVDMFFEIPELKNYTEKRKKAIAKVIEDGLQNGAEWPGEEIANIKGITRDMTLVDEGIKAIVEFDLDTMDHEKFKEKTGKSIKELFFELYVRQYGEDIQFDKLKTILEAGGAVEMEE